MNVVTRSRNILMGLLAACATGLAAGGCARDRDFAVVEPNLSRQYQTTPAAFTPAPVVQSSRVVGVQPVSGQVGAFQPVYASQQLPPAPNGGSVIALPPASSTGGVVADPNGQPYYAPPLLPSGAAVAPSPLGTTQGFMPNSSLSGPAVVTNPGGGAGVYPVTPTAMWSPANGNQQIAVHQFSTPTTGSSFVPSVTMTGDTPSNMQSADGIVPASATVPFTSLIPPNAPPATNARPPFLSESRENEQPSRIPIGNAGSPADAAAPLPRPPITKPTLDPDAGRRPLADIDAERPDRRKDAKSVETQPPVGSLNDPEFGSPAAPKSGEKSVAPGADPSRTKTGNNPLPANIDLQDPPKKNLKAVDPAPKSEGKKKADDASLSPGFTLPGDDPAPPPKAPNGTGS